MEAILQIISDASDVIRAGSERVVAIVRSLRSFGRLDEAELKNVSIHEGIEDTVHHGRIEVESRVGEGTTVTTILSYGFTGFGPAMTRGCSSTAPLRATPATWRPDSHSSGSRCSDSVRAGSGAARLDQHRVRKCAMARADQK